MRDFHRWQQMGAENEWKMPFTSRWKRLFIIRHVRTLWMEFQMELWYSYGPGSIGIRTGYDSWVIYGMWHGKERVK
jgi:hypothetical protein